MARSLLTFVILLSFFPVLSQVYVQGTRIDSVAGTYATIELSKTWNNTVRMEMDYGQPHAFLRREWVTDATGVPLHFNSMVAALNFLEEQGWQFKNNWMEEIVDDQTDLVILLERKNPVSKLTGSTDYSCLEPIIHNN